MPGESCVIQHYVDRDPGPGARDYACHGLTYDGHRGTDIRVATEADLHRAPPLVRAAAAGTVTAIRDEMPDALIGQPGALPRDQIAGRECGNGVVIRHEDGWETQYCHMARGSISVAPGDELAEGDPLGRMGESGATEFPHLHFSLRRDGKTVDPFAPAAETDCGDATGALWRETPAYRPGGFLAAGTLERIPDYAEVRRGLPPRPEATRRAPALVLWGFGYGARAGDAIRFVLEGPDGEVFDRTELLEKPQAQVFRAFGRRTPPDGWPAGDYHARLEWRRDGAVIDIRTVPLSLSD
ncbi:M23 family metallopeptidase [Poseidonocella sp. HB161398]|uniref:M23 family metallopeptidase n=1 Tax=Poseidonocella sp. HB161398 TaxID=2320855 RepID=UPI001F0F8763|nr:M23 family metallopeptidase [Poseidonocella sp. HB161398]